MLSLYHYTWVDSCPHCIYHGMKFSLYWFAFLFLAFLLAVNPGDKNDAIFLSHCLPNPLQAPSWCSIKILNGTTD